NKVYILVDNLDKAWEEGANLKLLSLFLFDFLGVAQDIANEFQKSAFRKKAVQLTLLVFLRSDIFAYIRKEAREVDKMVSVRIRWDAKLLQRVVEDRFLRFAPSLSSPEQVWQRFFAEKVKGQSTKEYLTNRIIPRPRDI